MIMYQTLDTLLGLATNIYAGEAIFIFLYIVIYIYIYIYFLHCP